MFSLKTKTEEIEIEQLDGTMKKYSVHELNGRELEAYLNDSRKNVILTDVKVSGMKTFDGMYCNLLKRTVFIEESALVLEPDINLWQASLQKEIFDISQRLSGLSGGDKSKND